MKQVPEGDPWDRASGNTPRWRCEMMCSASVHPFRRCLKTSMRDLVEGDHSEFRAVIEAVNELGKALRAPSPAERERMASEAKPGEGKPSSLPQLAFELPKSCEPRRSLFNWDKLDGLPSP